MTEQLTSILTSKPALAWHICGRTLWVNDFEDIKKLEECDSTGFFENGDVAVTATFADFETTITRHYVAPAQTISKWLI